MVMHAVTADLRPEETVTDSVVREGRSLRRAAEGHTSTGTVEIGPATLGAMVRCRPADSTIAIGDRAAPQACALLEFTDREYESLGSGRSEDRTRSTPDRR